MQWIHRFRLIAGLAVLAGVLGFATSATANRTYHTLTAPLSPISGQPLQSGWVHDIHMDGNVNGAHEEYHLAGALPNTTFQVEILFYSGAGCATTAAKIDTAVLMTNGAGDANGDWTFPANHTSTVTTDSASWQLVGPDGPAYTTPCEPVLIGGK